MSLWKASLSRYANVCSFHELYLLLDSILFYFCCIKKGLESAMDTMRGLASEKQTELIAFVPHDCPTLVIGDAFRLTQVLTKYTQA